MTAITFDAPSHIRKVNVRKDLSAVADLIEICFSSTLDEDGREYLRNLRWAARDAVYLSWIQGASDRLSTPLYGFVWQEGDRIVGNLSLIPLYRNGRLYYLIANVAVHPEYRQRGIGRQLTQTALDNLRERDVETAWLQVRDDNPAALNLYHSLGFVERARRTTWLSSESPPLVARYPAGGISIGPRRSNEWDLQKAWLSQIYPNEITWNLPFSLARFSPDPWIRFLRFLRGEVQQQWVARAADRTLGFLVWEPARAAADSLWLAAQPSGEEQAITALLLNAREALALYRRPLSVNYPSGRAAEAFLRAGFTHHQTLVWMNARLK